jgi:hypothetical protein
VVDPNPGRGMPAQLQRYWLVGKGAAKIRWNTPGDFLRCVRALATKFPKNPKGLCNILHTKATGGPPGHGSAEHSVDTAESLTAAASLLASQPGLGRALWAGPLAPIGRPTGEPAMVRIFDPGALRHRTLPLPLNHRRITGAGHTGSVTVGRILGISYGPDENGNEFAWGWGDWLDSEYVPEVREARYLVEQGVAGPSLDPGGKVVASVNPETGHTHMAEYTSGGATLVSIPAFAELRLVTFDADDEPAMGEDMPDGMYDFDLDAEEDCGCDGAPIVAEFTVNPPGWRGLPLAARDSVFDNDDAIKRIAAWAGIGTETPDVSKMKRAFMWHDSKLPETDPTAYRLPVGDIINGKLTLVFHAIYAAAALISGAHGGLPSISEGEKIQLRNIITEIYQGMAEDFGDSSIKAPWDRPGGESQGAAFAMDADEPYGDVSYADPGYQGDKKKRYPIDTPEHIRAAWSYINQKGNAGKYTGPQVASIKKRIAAAAEKAGIEISDTQFSSIPIEPPSWWFDDPMLPGKTPLTVEPSGRVYGHLAAWNECHRDVGNRECVLAPHSKLGYRPFHLGTVRTAEGDTVQVGKIVQDTRHAGINLGYMSAAIHYDHTGDEAAVVRAGEDAYGIWVAGSVVPDASAKKIAKLRRSPISGDWRAVEGNLELTAALAVNVPAFPVYAMEGAERLALTAAGTVIPEDGFFSDDEPTDDHSVAEVVFAAFQDAVKGAPVVDIDEEEIAEFEAREARAQWIEDIKGDEEIYAQRARAAKLESLRAAAMAPAPAAPAAAPAAPVAGAQAPVDPNAPVPAPADPAAGADAELLQQQFARQMNASFSIVQEADGSTPPKSAPASQAPASQQAPQAAAPAPAAPAPAQE